MCSRYFYVCVCVCLLACYSQLTVSWVKNNKIKISHWSQTSHKISNFAYTPTSLVQRKPWRPQASMFSMGDFLFEIKIQFLHRIPAIFYVHPTYFYYLFRRFCTSWVLRKRKILSRPFRSEALPQKLSHKKLNLINCVTLWKNAQNPAHKSNSNFSVKYVKNISIVFECVDIIIIHFRVFQTQVQYVFQVFLVVFGRCFPKNTISNYARGFERFSTLCVSSQV